MTCIRIFSISFVVPIFCFPTCCIYFCMKLMLLYILWNRTIKEMQHLGRIHTSVWIMSDHLIHRIRFLKAGWYFFFFFSGFSTEIPKHEFGKYLPPWFKSELTLENSTVAQVGRQGVYLQSPWCLFHSWINWSRHSAGHFFCSSLHLLWCFLPMFFPKGCNIICYWSLVVSFVQWAYLPNAGKLFLFKWRMPEATVEPF